MSCDELGIVPNNVVYDHNLMRLACLKSEFVKSLKHLCKEMLEQDEMPIVELEKYI